MPVPNPPLKPRHRADEVVGNAGRARLRLRHSPNARASASVEQPGHPGPFCENRFLDGHYPVEVGHQTAIGYARHISSVDEEGFSCLTQPRLIDLDQRGDLDEGPPAAGTDDVAGLGEHNHAQYRRVDTGD